MQATRQNSPGTLRKKMDGEGFKRPWPPCGAKALGERRLTLIKMDVAVKAKVEKLFNP